MSPDYSDCFYAYDQRMGRDILVRRWTVNSPTTDKEIFRVVNGVIDRSRQFTWSRDE